VHNFSLLHDDVMDRDVMRRHRPTVWAVWGAASAILTGDALLALAQEVLLECESGHANRAAALLAATTRLLVRGQVQDLAFEQRSDVTLEECLEMAAGKTGALLSASAAIGAVLAGAPQSTVDALSAYGAHLGIAFQVVDDVLGIWGDPGVTGKPVYSDLRSRKKSLPVTYAMTQDSGPAGEELATWLAGTGPVDEADLPRAARLVAAAGGRDWARAEAKRRIELAEGALDGQVSGPARAELSALGQSIVDRQA
jgi:geranylgeranyl diphosphate synthase type I